MAVGVSTTLLPSPSLSRACQRGACWLLVLFSPFCCFLPLLPRRVSCLVAERIGVDAEEAEEGEDIGDCDLERPTKDVLCKSASSSGDGRCGRGGG
eukprot:m.194197 g.194197  ORF g.194197 m.194197 type:complete len:96 (-) comp24996_c0_seq7:1414-1701(-)